MEVENEVAANIESGRKLEMVLQAANELKARDIKVLDVRGQTIVADFFVMCTGTSITHIQSIAEGVRDRLRENARLRAKPEGDAGSFWVIMDYSDVIMHIFDEETREFYDLERLWADAKITQVDEDGTQTVVKEQNEVGQNSESSAEIGAESPENS